jgi:glycosyltransferase involved in cell wall biosynthesis
MSDPKRNAAIWYASDAYKPEKHGLNGRRMAGQSFLRGFFEHADVDEFVSYTLGPKGHKEFAELAVANRVVKPLRATHFNAPHRLDPVNTVYYGAANFAEECWRRHTKGDAAFSLCGITHTTATKAVMQGLIDLRTSPQREWDGVICTSKAVHASQMAHLEMVDDYLAQRFGKAPPRPQMPVIPLGIHCDDFAHVPEARESLRSRMGWGEKDVVVMTLSRLIPYGKFDPFPLYLALARAQEELASEGIKLHFVACGIYADDHSKTVFEQGARDLMSEVSFTHLDGKDPVLRREALSGGDIFTFPIDNIQETFGLAPIEAMAAGLPVVVSDWDGMKDTITPEVGFRIPTRTVPGDHAKLEAWLFNLSALGYAQYGNNTSALTEIDLPEMTRAFVTLARDPDLRKRMGAAGVRRAREVYDWAQVIPLMQDFWAELEAIRAAHVRAHGNPVPAVNPAAPSPFALFESYPTEQLTQGPGPCVIREGAGDVATMFKQRRYDKMRPPFEQPAPMQNVLDAVASRGADGADISEIAKAVGYNPVSVNRMFTWLLKYGFLERRG